MEDFKRRALVQKIINLAAEGKGERFSDTQKQKNKSPSFRTKVKSTSTGLHCVFIVEQIISPESIILGQVGHHFR